jgi:hypothetical protein
MKTKALGFALMAAALVFGAVWQSYADVKVYPASQCVRWDEANDPPSNLSFGRRYNPSATKRLRLDCPAVKDRSTDIRASWIRVIDRHPGDQICARIVAYRQFGAVSVLRQGAAQCTDIAANSPDVVQLNTGGLAAVPEDAHYYVSVYRIPARAVAPGGDSGVVTYAVDEIDFD